MPGTVIGGRYRLDELLGRGGMSEVWCADDLELGRRVAIKLLAGDADTARFEREARAVASLGHPNVTRLYDYGEDAGRPYMVLEYLPGGTLEDRLRGGEPLPDEETAAIAGGLAAGLAHAHSRGVVHRDLKPANVLFDDEGRPKLADFGIARLAAGEGTLTEAGTVLGTASYISPEQAAGAAATAASDVYSFGVILYRMLTGRLPFESSNPMELVLLHRDADVPPLDSLRADAPDALAATASAALAKSPLERPRDGTALLGELGLAAGAEAAAAPPLLAEEPTRILPAAAAPAAAGEDGPPPPPPRRSRVPLLVAALVVLALAGAALAYALTRPSSSPGDTGTIAPLTLPSQGQTAATQTGATRPAATGRPTTASTTAPTTTRTTEPTTREPSTRQETTTAAPPTTAATPPTTTAAPPTTTAAPPTTTAPTTGAGGTTTAVTTAP